jgi:hypothetical protein
MFCANSCFPSRAIIEMSGLWDRITGVSSLNLALRLTLLNLLLHPIGGEWLRLSILAVAAAGMLVPDLLQRPALWGILTLLTGSRVLLDWPLPDNHAYLLSYWCLAITLSCCFENRDRALAFEGRWLIAAVFGFATLWKLVLAPDFVDGTFFRVTLLTDPRFEAMTRLIGGLSFEQIDAARAALSRHADGATLESLAAATPSSWLKGLAFVITGWTLAIEFAVSVSFCWLRGSGPSRLRDALLILFCATTYAVATVDGFGWLLIAMGVAQCEVDRPRIRAAYLATFALIFFYREVPWLTILADLMMHGG